MQNREAFHMVVPPPQKKKTHPSQVGWTCNHFQISFLLHIL